MASPRHKKAVAGVRARRIMTAAAMLVLVGGVAGSSAAGAPGIDRASASADPQARLALLSEIPHRPLVTDQVSRTGERGPLPRRSAERADRPEPTKRPDVVLEPRWLTADLNVWSGPGEDNRLLNVRPEGDKVQVTGFVTGVWAQIVRADGVGWVRAAYLADEKPVVQPAATEAASSATSSPSAGGGSVSGAACPDGSAVESGLVSNTIAVYRSVCASFPAVSSWGGLRVGDDGDHGTGHALDIMVGSDSGLGSAIAAFVQEHASQLGVSEIIWSQQIWSVERSSEGWRPMEDRGSTTANHYDHVHVSVY